MNRLSCRCYWCDLPSRKAIARAWALCLAALLLACAMLAGCDQPSVVACVQSPPERVVLCERYVDLLCARSVECTPSDFRACSNDTRYALHCENPVAVDPVKYAGCVWLLTTLSCTELTGSRNRELEDACRGVVTVASEVSP